MPGSLSVSIVDSHTGGEPTRVILDGGPALGTGSMAARLERLRTGHDSFRSGVVLEPRGSDVVVGALLQPPLDPAAATGVLFFNDVGYLGMCGHGTIGVVKTLAHLGRIGPGIHRIETPVGTVTATLHDDSSVTVENLPAYRLQTGVSVEVPGYGAVTGDVAWGGNNFFLTADHGFDLVPAGVATLLRYTTALRTALQSAGITGVDGGEVDHIELFTAPHDARNSSRNFVLCPGAAFDRSPCGTGTSAKLACLYADGRLAPGEIWRQESILGTVFEGSIAVDAQGTIWPSIRGRAWITGETRLLFEDGDPCIDGVHW